MEKRWDCAHLPGWVSRGHGGSLHLHEPDGSGKQHSRHQTPAPKTGSSSVSGGKWLNLSEPVFFFFMCKKKKKCIKIVTQKACRGDIITPASYSLSWHALLSSLKFLPLLSPVTPAPKEGEECFPRKLLWKSLSLPMKRGKRKTLQRKTRDT